MTVSVSTDLRSVQTLKGRRERSTLVTVSEKIWVPKRSLCALGAQQQQQWCDSFAVHG
jgi:hypothetical protein